MKTYTYSLQRIQARLDDWGDWQREGAIQEGGRIGAADFDQFLGTQRRNDTHADPVFQEIRHMSRKQQRIAATHNAYLELRPARLKALVYARHAVYPEATTSHIADAIGYKRRSIRHDLDIAYAIIDELIGQRLRQSKNVA